MGDRACVFFKGEGLGDGFGVYVHWAGTALPSLVADGMRNAVRLGRATDSTYAARIIVTHIAKSVVSDPDDGTGMGLFGANETPEDEHGGPLVVDFDFLRVSGRGRVDTFAEFVARNVEVRP